MLADEWHYQNARDMGCDHDAAERYADRRMEEEAELRAHERAIEARLEQDRADAQQYGEYLQEQAERAAYEAHQEEMRDAMGEP